MSDTRLSSRGKRNLGIPPIMNEDFSARKARMQFDMNSSNRGDKAHESKLTNATGTARARKNCYGTSRGRCKRGERHLCQNVATVVHSAQMQNILKNEEAAARRCGCPPETLQQGLPVFAAESRNEPSTRSRRARRTHKMNKNLGEIIAIQRTVVNTTLTTKFKLGPLKRFWSNWISAIFNVERKTWKRPKSCQ